MPDTHLTEKNQYGNKPSFFRKLAVLSLGDFKNIIRDPMLCFALAIPLICGGGVRIILPFFAQLLHRELNFNLTAYYDLFMSILIMVPALLYGWICGFLILDERDEQILSYIAVTPVSKRGFLLYRLSIPVLLSIPGSFLVLILSGLTEIKVVPFLPVVLLAALEAPMVSLFLGAFAKNKVEGLALAKGLGVFLLAPILGYFIRSPWTMFAGIAPPYWVSMAFLTGDPARLWYWIYIGAGIVVHAACLLLLLKKFSGKDY